MINLKRNILILFVLLFGSCSNYSNLSNNITKKGVFYLRGGVKGSDLWKTDLSFERIS